MNEQTAVEYLITQANLPAEIAKQTKQSTTFSALAQFLTNLEDKPPSANALLAQIQQSFTPDLATQIINQYLSRLIPKFVYFDDYSIMCGQISITHLRQLQNSGNLSGADRTFLSLLSLAGVRLEELENERNYERLKADLEAASISISDEVFEFWSQNRQLQVEFDISVANGNEPAPLNTGTILHVRIRNDRHRVSVPFDERSKGFVWFFSFLAYFSQLEDQEANLILLLDEPGLSLHAKAQSDFLRFIDQRLAPKHQVAYTTHSPFMVNPSQLQRVRTVQDVDGKGTVVSDEVLRNDRDTVFPLQAALGYELAQTLFVGPNCLLLEGPSDLIYLQLLSEITATKRGISLDPRWVLVPVGGADKISTFVSLLGGNQLNNAVVMDVNAKDRPRFNNLQAHVLLRRNNLIEIGEIVGAKEADIEDLFEPAFYLEVISGAYADKLIKPLKEVDLPPGSPRIIKRIEAYFQQNGIGEFNHFKPSAYLLHNQNNLVLQPHLGGILRGNEARRKRWHHFPQWKNCASGPRA